MESARKRRPFQSKMVYKWVIGVMNGPLKFLTARKILPLLDLLAKFKRMLARSCSLNFCVARKLAKQIFYFCSCSQKNRSARHARECSQRPFVTPGNGFIPGAVTPRIKLCWVSRVVGRVNFAFDMLIWKTKRNEEN